MLPFVYILPFAIMIGLAFGSFLTVLVSRLPDPDRSVFTPARSECPMCKHQIAWYDNIPVLSWALLGGKCRNCPSRIGWIYPALELVTAAAVVAALAFYWPNPVAVVRLAVYLILLIAIAGTDVTTYLIPDLYTVWGSALLLVLAYAQSGWPQAWHLGVEGLLVGLLLYGFGKLGSALLGKEALGTGDAFMVGMIGCYAGFGGSLVSIFLGALAGLLFHSLAILYLRKKQIVSMSNVLSLEPGTSGLTSAEGMDDSTAPLVPFGLYLALGGAAVVLVPVFTTWATNFTMLLPWH